MRSQPKSPPERTPFSFLIRPAGMPRKPWWFRATSHSCRCRRVHPSSTARKTSGSSCARIGYQTGSLNPSTISSTTAATPGTHSSINPGRSCPSRDATGQQSVTQSEDWYKALPTDIGSDEGSVNVDDLAGCDLGLQTRLNRALEDRAEPIGAPTLANPRQARMIGQPLVNAITDEPASSDVDMRLTHQLAVMHDTAKQARKHEADCDLG